MANARGSSSRWVVVLAAPVFWSGCATVASGDYGVALDAQGNRVPAAAAASPLAISAAEIGLLSSTHFGAIEVTFENATPAWVQIDRVDLDFGTAEKNRSVLVPWGANIDSWQRAITQRNAISYSTPQAVRGLLAFDAALACGARRDPIARQLGGDLEPAAVAAFAARTVPDAAPPPETVDPFPSTHLLNLPIRIPPGLFTKRWLLLYTAERPAGGCIDAMVLGYTTSDHQQRRVLVRFKSDYMSDWQKQSCGGYGAVPGPAH